MVLQIIEICLGRSENLAVGAGNGCAVLLYPEQQHALGIVVGRMRSDPERADRGVPRFGGAQRAYPRRVGNHRLAGTGARCNRGIRAVEKIRDLFKCLLAWPFADKAILVPGISYRLRLERATGIAEHPFHAMRAAAIHEAVVMRIQEQQRNLPFLVQGFARDKRVAPLDIGYHVISGEVDRLGYRIDAERAKKIIDMVQDFLVHVFGVENPSVEDIHAVTRPRPWRAFPWKNRILDAEFLFRVRYGRQQTIQQPIVDARIRARVEFVAIRQHLAEELGDVATEDVHRGHHQHRPHLGEHDPAQALR